MFTTIIGLILSIAKAVPVIDGWIQLLMVAYSQHEDLKMKKENRDAIKTALEKDDQRDLETALGSTKVGLPSGVPGSVIVDKLPGVK